MHLEFSLNSILEISPVHLVSSTYSFSLLLLGAALDFIGGEVAPSAPPHTTRQRPNPMLFTVKAQGPTAVSNQSWSRRARISLVHRWRQAPWRARWFTAIIGVILLTVMILNSTSHQMFALQESAEVESASARESCLMQFALDVELYHRARTHRSHSPGDKSTLSVCPTSFIPPMDHPAWEPQPLATQLSDEVSTTTDDAGVLGTSSLSPVLYTLRFNPSIGGFLACPSQHTIRLHHSAAGDSCGIHPDAMVDAASPWSTVEMESTIAHVEQKLQRAQKEEPQDSNKQEQLVKLVARLKEARSHLLSVPGFDLRPACTLNLTSAVGRVCDGHRACCIQADAFQMAYDQTCSKRRSMSQMLTSITVWWACELELDAVDDDSGEKHVEMVAPHIPFVPLVDVSTLADADSWDTAVLDVCAPFVSSAQQSRSFFASSSGATSSFLSPSLGGTRICRILAALHDPANNMG